MTEKISLYEHAVRKLRFMRVSGESATALKLQAAGFQRNLGLDPDKLLLESEKPGSIEGHPYTAARMAALTKGEGER